MENLNNIDNPSSFPKTQLKWQGEPVKVESLYIKVWEYKEKPLWWFNYEVDKQRSENLGHDYAIIEALKVTYENQSFYISNHFGVGIRKLRKGGWPNHSHFSFDGNFKEYSTNMTLHPTISFCLKDYENHEANRRAWQKKNFPEEFERSERLRKMMIKSPIYN